MTHTPIRRRTVSLIGKILRPISDEGVIPVAELREILTQLKHLATKGTICPPVEPKLLNQREVAERLGIGHSNFKKLEREGRLDLPRRMVGSSVRYRSTDVFRFIMAGHDATDAADA